MRDVTSFTILRAQRNAKRIKPWSATFIRPLLEKRSQKKFTSLFRFRYSNCLAPSCETATANPPLVWVEVSLVPCAHPSWATTRILQLDEALIEQQREAYKVPGVEENEEANVKQQRMKNNKRKKDANGGDEVCFVFLPVYGPGAEFLLTQCVGQ
jgi:hypothetical protein